MYAKLSGLMALALVGTSAASTCLTPPKRTQPGRDVTFGDTVCPNQITACSALCGKTSTNTCTSNNNGSDDPFQSITYCYQCTCSDGSTPDLAKYANTVPTLVCERTLQNCQYSYSQIGLSAPAGACPACGDDTPAPKATTTAAATTIATTTPKTATSTSTTTPTTAKPTTTSTKPEPTTTSTAEEETTSSSPSSTSSEVPSSTTAAVSSAVSSKVSSVISSGASTRGPGTTISAITVPSITRTQPALSSSTGAAATKGVGVGVGVVGIVFVQVVRLVL
ncbi:hypothetical protein B0T25DRAFT_569498 [Lasiosphaeria hispida]|uniref:DUF7707 domain-containing protein n=1 Tax=Lasiosphaeria hispida TaxID=260671 RepID=A0AAJ0MBV0_9PEZI|nr:hypothetical protein B0T25DRAFT_569498 [Lasiosphaeria hispida]